MLEVILVGAKMNDIFSHNVELKVEKIFMYCRYIYLVLFTFCFSFLSYQIFLGDSVLMPQLLRAFVLSLFSFLFISVVLAQLNDVKFEGNKVFICRYWFFKSRKKVYTLESIESGNSPHPAFTVLRFSSGKPLYIWATIKMHPIAEIYFPNKKVESRANSKLLLRYILDRRDFYQIKS